MKVKVSPDYTGVGWYDPTSGINFFKTDKEIVIPEGRDLKNIKRYINLNYLILIEDEVVETQPDFIYQTPNQLLAEEAIEEEVLIIEEPIQDIEEDQSDDRKEEVQKEEIQEEVLEEVLEEATNLLDCQYCGRTLKSASGRITHEKSCKENPNK